MNVGSLFSGIGGFDEGLRRAGHEHVFFCESDPYRRDVLRARFPGVPVFDDVGALGKPAWGVAIDAAGAPVDLGRWEAGTGLLCGGFPCQDLSVAGRRAGLAGDRSGLFFEFARIAESLRPSWLLVENVPGLLSSNGGRDFGVVLGTLADLGYGMAWRIVDSRFFGVPQRRRRVFIVGAFADGDPRAAAERASEVLAVGSGCARHLAPRGQAREDVAGTLGSSVGEGRGWDANPDRTTLIANSISRSGPPGTRRDDDAALVAAKLKSHRGKGGGGIGPEETLIAAPLTKGSATGEGVNAPGRRQEDDVNIVACGLNTNRGGNADMCVEEELAPAITGSHGNPGDVMQVQAFSWQQGDDSKFTGTGRGRSWVARAGDYAAGLSATGRHDAISGEAVGVRRLTPTECERLQGFPDGWTQLGKTPDSRRYSALGDAVTVNVSEWIGNRLP